MTSVLPSLPHEYSAVQIIDYSKSAIEIFEVDKTSLSGSKITENDLLSLVK